MTCLFVEYVDADCDDDLDDEEDQCPQPVPHDCHSLLPAAATGCPLLLSAIRLTKRPKRKREQSGARKVMLGTGI
jgi:hypothetical protein